jgi:hypothetical protein
LPYCALSIVSKFFFKRSRRARRPDRGMGDSCHAATAAVETGGFTVRKEGSSKASLMTPLELFQCLVVLPYACAKLSDLSVWTPPLGAGLK